MVIENADQDVEGILDVVASRLNDGSIVNESFYKRKFDPLIGVLRKGGSENADSLQKEYFALMTRAKKEGLYRP